MSRCRKAQKFDKKSYEAGDYTGVEQFAIRVCAEANVNAARGYLAGGWDGCMEMVGSVPAGIGIRGPLLPRFIPGDGIFYSPFGWGFYSPFIAYESAGLFPWTLSSSLRRMISTHGVRGCTIHRACAEVDTATGSTR